MSQINDQLDQPANLSNKVYSVEILEFGRSPSGGKKISIDFQVNLIQNISYLEMGDYLTDYFLLQGGTTDVYKFYKQGSRDDSDVL